MKAGLLPDYTHHIEKSDTRYDTDYSPGHEKSCWIELYALPFIPPYSTEEVYHAADDGDDEETGYDPTADNHEPVVDPEEKVIHSLSPKTLPRFYVELYPANHADPAPFYCKPVFKTSVQLVQLAE